MKTRINLASLTYQKDEGTALEVRSVPLFWVVLDEIIYEVDGRLGHILCSPPEWAYALRWGPVDEDGYTDKSLGHRWFEFGQWVLEVGFRREKHLGRVPVSFDWVREHMPDAGWPWDGSDPEDEETGSPDEQDKVS